MIMQDHDCIFQCSQYGTHKFIFQRCGFWHHITRRFCSQNWVINVNKNFQSVQKFAVFTGHDLHTVLYLLKTEQFNIDIQFTPNSTVPQCCRWP